MSEYKRWKFVDEKKGKNYGMIQYSLGKPKANPTSISWSKPIRIGNRKFKNLLLDEKLNIADFPQYKISSSNYVYFDQNNLKTQGRGFKQDVLSDKDLDKLISYDLMFYAPVSELQKRQGGKKGFRLDVYSHMMRQMRWDGRTENFYPLFRRKFHFISKKKVLHEFLRRFKNPWECRNNTAYNYFWSTFLQQVGGTAIMGVDKGAIDSVSDIAVGIFDNERLTPLQEAQRLNYQTAVAMDDFFMNCKNYLQKTKDDDYEKTILPFLPHNTISSYPKNACLYIELMKTYKASMDRAYKSEKRPMYKDFCYAKIWKIIHGDKPLPLENDYEQWGLSWNQVLKFFQYYRIEATLYSGYDGKVECHYHPEQDGKSVNKKINPKHFRYVWSNNHCWAMRKCGDELWNRKLMSKKETIKEISEKVEWDLDLTHNTIQPVSYDFNHLRKDKNEIEYTPVYNSVDEIYAFLESEVEHETSFIVITNLDLEYVFLELRFKYKLLCSLDMRGNCVNKLHVQKYYNKNVTIQQAYTPATAQVLIHDINDYKLMNEYLTKVKKMFLTPQYSSFYSPQVFNVLHTFKKGGINCCFDWNKNDECLDEYGNLINLCGQSDFNRFYISVLLELDQIPIFNFDDYFFDYSNEPLQDLNLYYIRKTNETFEYPFYKDDLCFGMNLKKSLQDNYTILKVLKPSSYRENNLKSIFKEIYNSGLPDDLIKNIGNILCGWLVQKTKNVHKSFFSVNQSEVYNLRYEIGGSIYPFHYNDTEAGFAFTKCFSKPLMNGFYFIGLLLLDTTHLKMDILRSRLDECGLEPFAIKTDCIYHAIDSVKYNDFKVKYPEYFNYSDKNQFDAIGKIKYEEKKCGAWNFFQYKTFDFKFDLPQINEITIKDEWNIDEFVDVIKNHQSLFVFGHGGFGKSSSLIRACEKLGLKILILTKTHPLSDKYHHMKLNSNKYNYGVCTAESFFKLNEYSEIPFCRLNYNIACYDVVLLDDALLCNLKIFNQWMIFKEWVKHNKPELKLLGNGDPLQLEMLFNDNLNSFRNFDDNKYDKMISMMSRLFGNIITLQENKRLKSPHDRQLNKDFINVCKSGDREKYMEFCRKNMNVVKSFFDIPMNVRKHIRHVIVPENRERPFFNNTCFALEFGTYSPRFQVGHIVMAQKGNFQLKFKSFQLFKIDSKDKHSVVITNILRPDHILKLSLTDFDKYFVLPYARTAHSYQGSTIDDVLVVYGFHHLYLDTNWFYTADSRTTSFKNVYHIVDDTKQDESLNQRSFIQQKINNYIQQDIDRGMTIDFDKYIDVIWIELELRRMQYKCSYCSIDVYSDWTIDRLNSELPHYKSNSCISCFTCNCAKKDRI